MKIFDAVVVKEKSGRETFYSDKINLEAQVIDFWSWSQSDLLNNTLRGVLAEFIVAKGLNVPMSVRVEWDTFDILTDNGIKIEVKSSAYLQSWKQKKISNIQFDIRPTRKFCEETSSYLQDIVRHSDFYVFCLLTHKEKATVDPLNLAQWVFYVLPTATLNEKKPAQKTITLNSLLKLEPTECRFDELKSVVDRLTITDN